MGHTPGVLTDATVSQFKCLVSKTLVTKNIKPTVSKHTKNDNLTLIKINALRTKIINVLLGRI